MPLILIDRIKRNTLKKNFSSFHSTAPPYLNLVTLVSNHTGVNEYQDLVITCFADGIPKPNVTWLKVEDDGVIMNQGVGNSSLILPNITRNESGTYNCCAINNPSENPICRSTNVFVEYKPEIDIDLSNSTVSSFNGNTIILYCLAIGEPSPKITWYDPRRQNITRGLKETLDGSVLKLKTEKPDHYGLYRCKATNKFGYDEHVIHVTETVVPTTKWSKKSTTITGPSQAVVYTGDDSTIISSFATKETKMHQDKLLFAAGGAAIFVLAVAIVILIVMIMKNYDKDKDSKQQQTNQEGMPLPQDNEENNPPIYAKVDLSKKKRNRLQDDTPIYAMVDKSKKKRPGQIIYTELDHRPSTDILPSVLPPPLPNRSLHDEMNGSQNTSCNEPIYESVACDFEI